jgi:ABC-type xylose transport system permease subunit
MTWGLLVLGGVLLVGALVWGWMIRRRAAAARVSLEDLVIPAVTLVMGVSLLGWGVGTISPLETLPIEASEREEVRVDLPTRTTRVRMQARAAGSASWVTLAEIRVEESERTQELTVPSLETIRAARPGDWSQLQVVVLERARLEIGLPAPLVILLVVALIASVFLNRTIYGRYLLAMGNNEQAARYSGIDTDRMIILAYVICAGLAGLGGVLFVLDINSAQPVDFGNFYELYAIAAAVLGGCSLRGGQGTILGVVIGAALMRVLKNMITLVDWMPTYIEYAIIGAVILAGVTVDELVKRAAARRRLQRIRGGADESGR